MNWHNSDFKRSATVLMMLAVMCVELCFSATINDVCVALKAVSLPPSSQQHYTTPDGLDGIAISNFNNLTWISPADCDPKKPYSGSTEWKNTDIKVTEAVGENPVTTEAQSRYVVDASFGQNGLTVSARIEFKFKLQIEHGPTVPMTGQVGFSMKNVPTDLLGRAVPLWTGDMSGSVDGMTIIDSNLFDGIPARVFHAGMSGTPSTETLSTIENIARHSTNIAARVKFFEMVPSALSGDLTARMAFPDPSQLNVEEKDVKMIGGNLAYSEATYSCEDNDCGDAVIRVLQNFAEGDNKCTDPTMSHAVGGLSAIITVDSDKGTHSVISSRAFVQGFLSCKNNGQMMITLEALSDPNGTDYEFNTEAFLNDGRSAALMTKATSVSLSGSRVAYIDNGNNEILTTMEGDLFGIDRGGSFVEDVAISDNTRDKFIKAVEEFASQIHTRREALDHEVSIKLNETNPGKLFDYYFNFTAKPTGHGLWQYWAHQLDGIDIRPDDENPNTLRANVDLTLRHVKVPFESKEHIFEIMNEALSTLHDKLNGASQNWTKPVLDKNTDMSAFIDGAVSASIPIPKMDAHFRIRALEDADSWAVASVNANFSDPCTLKYAVITLILGLNDNDYSPSVDVALVRNDQYVALSSNGVVINDDEWDPSEISSVADSISNIILPQVRGNMSSSVEQLHLVTEGSSVTYADVVNTIADVLQKLQYNHSSIKSVSGVIMQVREKLMIATGDLRNLPFVSHLTVLPVFSDKRIEFYFDVYAIRHIYSEAQSDEWKRTIPLPRLHIQTPTTTALYFNGTVTASEATLSQFTQKGHSSISGFSLPVRNGMRSGVVNGTASVFIDFPASSQMVINLTGNMNRGGPVTALFVGNMTVHIDESSTEIPSNFFSWNFTEFNRGDYAQVAEPVEVVQSFFNNANIMSLIADHRLSSPIPPFSSPLGTFFNVSNNWDDDRAYFYTDDPNPVLAAVVINSSTVDVNEIYSFGVNNLMFEDCDMIFRGMNPSNAMDMFKDFVVSCTNSENISLSKYVTLEWVPDAEGNSNDDDNEGRIRFRPASPGLIYSFRVLVNASTPSPLKAQAYNAGKTTPDTLSWNDLYDAVYSTFFRNSNAKYSPPEFHDISVQDLPIVDSTRTQFYPDSFTAVMFPVHFHVEPSSRDVNISSSIVGDEIQAHFDINSEDQFTMPVSVSGDVSSVFGYVLWSSLGVGDLNIDTNFDENNTFDTVYVSDTNKTFTVTFTYETRTKASRNSVPIVTVSRNTVELTPGNLVYTELLNHVVDQINDANVKNMLVFENASDSIRQPGVVQASMIFSPYVTSDNESIYIPLSLSIDISNVPCWGDSVNPVVSRVVTAVPINKDFKTEIHVATNPATEDESKASCTGVTGVVSAKGTVTTKSVQSYYVVANHTYEFQANLIASSVNSTSFDYFFNSSATVETTFDVTDFSFGANVSSSSAIGQEVLRFLFKPPSLPFTNLTSNITDIKFQTDVISSGAAASALRSLISTNRSDLCQALRLADEASTNFSNDPSSQESLPFADASMGPIFRQRLGSILSTVANSVCSDSGELTVDPLCVTLNKSWGVEACADISLDDKALSLYIVANPPSFKVDAGFKFDVNKLIPFLGKNYTAGIGGDGDFVLIANTSASFGIRFGFTNSSEDKWHAFIELDPDHTKFHAGANIDANAQLKASFGSIQMNFASANVHLDAHFDAGYSPANNVYVEVDGAALFKAGVSVEPLFSCNIESDIPSLAAFIKGDPGSAVWSDACTGICGQNFTEILDFLANEMSLIKYFEQDPALFWKQFSSELDKVFEQLIQQILNRAVTFIGKQLQGLMHKALDKITGPEVADVVGREVADMVARFILNHTAPSPTDLEQIILDVFTGILNKVFQGYLRVDINTPVAGQQPYIWKFRFGQTIVKPLSNIDFHLGDHGIAQFGLKCQPSLQLNWDVDFNMVWSKEKGIGITWEDPAMEGNVSIINNDKCQMEGRLLYMAAVFTADLECDVDLKIRSDNKTLTAADFTVSSSIKGEAEIGLVGILEDKTNDIEKTLPALPHVKVQLEIIWNPINFTTDTGEHHTPSSFKFIEPQLCLGTLITKFLKRVTDQIDKVIKPIEPIFGKDGILLKKIDLLQPFLHDHNDLLGIIELMCKYYSDSCNVDGVRKLCDLIREFGELIERLNDFETWLHNGDEGCASFSLVYKTFHVDWTKSDPVPELPALADGTVVEYDDEGDYNYTGLDDNQKKTLHDSCEEWRREGEFKFTLDILNQFPQKIIMILLGENVALFSMSFPSAVFAFSTSWEIPVWDLPYIAILVGASASLEFRPPPIALMSNAVVDTIRTHDPSHIFRNLALRATEDGKPFFFVSGSIEISGGVSVGVSIYLVSVTGEATIFIRFDAGIALASPNGEEWITFDSLALQYRDQGIGGTVDVELSFSAGFRLALKGCIHYFIGKKCWTFASVSWSKEFGHWSYKPKPAPQVSDGSGNINGDVANTVVNGDDPKLTYFAYGRRRDNDYSRFTITPTDVLLLTRSQVDGDAPFQRPLSSNPNIRFNGDELCQGPISINIAGDVNFPIMLPNCDKALLNISQYNYELTDSSFTLTSDTISAGDRPAMTFPGSWDKIVLVDPDFSTAYSISGKPSCDVEIDTQSMSSLTVSGDPSGYGDKPIVMKGLLEEMSSTALCSDITIDADRFTCTRLSTSTNTIDVQVPSVLRDFSAVASVPEECLFHIISTPANRSVSLSSATSYTNFSVPNMADINAYTECIGNSAGQMYLLSTMRTPDNGPANIRLTLSSSTLDIGDGLSHTIHHTNIPYREYDIYGADERQTETVLMSPTEFDVVTIRSHGTEHGNMTHYVTGCHVRANVDIRLDGSGSQTVIFGDKEGMVKSACPASVIADGDDSLDSSIIVNANQDSRQLRWIFSSTSFSVSSLNSGSDTFQVSHDGIKKITVNFASQTSDVTIDTVYGNTEFVLNFPESSNNAGNKLRITGSPASVLVNGPVEIIRIGTTIESKSQTPFADVNGMIAVTKNTLIVLDSTKMDKGVDHSYKMDSLCFVDEVALKNKQFVISDWFIEQLKNSGMTVPAAGTPCSLLYNSNAKQSINILTSSGADNFTADGATIPVTMDLGDNADRVSLKNIKNVKFVVNLGSGADTLDIASTGDVDADLGADKMTDVVKVHYTTVSPNVDGETIYPVGENNAKLTINNWLEQDLISVVRDSDKRAMNNRFRAGFGSPVLINNTKSGSTLVYEEMNDTLYHVVGCARDARISMDVHSSTSPDLAYNAVVYVLLSDVSTTKCDVFVNSEIVSNGTTGLLVPDGVSSIPATVQLAKSKDITGTGLLEFGLLALHSTNISHYEISIPRVSLSQQGVIEVNYVPSDADLLVSVPESDWTVNLVSLQSIAVILDAVTNISAEILLNPITVITAGNSGLSVVNVDGTDAQELYFASGCLLTSDGEKGHHISDWLFYRTLGQYNVSIGDTHLCNVEVMNASSLYIYNTSQLGIGGLTSKFTTQVTVLGSSELNLTVDPQMKDSNLMKTYGSWTEVTYNGFANNSNQFIGKRDNGETFMIEVKDAKTLNVYPGVTKFVVGSQLNIDCADASAKTTVNMFDDFPKEQQIRATMKVTSSKCNAMINSMISKNTTIAPTVTLGHKLALDLDMTILGPSAPSEFEGSSSSAPLRSLNITVNNSTNRSSYVFEETPSGKGSKTVTLVNISWDSDKTTDIQHDLSDGSMYILNFDQDIIDSKIVKMNVSSSSMLSFGDLHGSTILFVDAKTSDYKANKRKFSISPAKSGDYCFDPCLDCTEGAWGRVVISGKICQPRDAQDSCKSRAKVKINVTGKMEHVSCGAATFDEDRNGTCSFAMNVNGLDNGVLTVPENVLTGTTIVIAASMILTVIGASSLIARIALSCRKYPNINIWWTRNSFRDLLTDQFSWAAIVMTACLPEVSDVDYSQWGGWVVAIMVRAKMFVLNWFVVCSDDGNPVWVTPATVVFWSVTGITLIIRIIELILKKRDITLNDTVQNTMLGVQSVLSVTGFLLIPLVGYSLAFLNSESYAGFASAVCIILLFLSQPVDGFNKYCLVGVVVSVINVLLPVAMCIYVGVGANFMPVIVMALLFTVILPIIDSLVLWFSFFRKTTLRGAAWKHSIGWTTSLRIISMICGIGFLVLLFFELSETMSKIAAGLWFGWVCIPFLSVIPLTAGVPSILTASETVASRKPLLGGQQQVIDESSPLLKPESLSDDPADPADGL